MRALDDYSYLIFDFDLTLFDTLDGVTQCYRETLPLIGSDTSDINRETVGRLCKSSLSSVFNSRRTNSCKYSDFEREFIRVGQRCVHKRARIFPDVLPALERLDSSDRVCSIMTGNNRYTVTKTLERFGLGSLFDEIVCYGEYKREKPYPDGLERVLELSGANREDCLYIGDSPSDLTAASAAGMDGVLIDRSCKSHDNTISTLEELV